MTNRDHMSDRERHARSRLTQLLHEQDVLAGCLVRGQNTCGKPTCRCHRGQKHPTAYIELRFGERRHVRSVSRTRRESVGKAVDNYHTMRHLLEVVSEECCARLLQRR